MTDVPRVELDSTIAMQAEPCSRAAAAWTKLGDRDAGTVERGWECEGDVLSAGNAADALNGLAF